MNTTDRKTTDPNDLGTDDKTPKTPIREDKHIAQGDGDARDHAAADDRGPSIRQRRDDDPVETDETGDDDDKQKVSRR